MPIGTDRRGYYILTAKEAAIEHATPGFSLGNDGREHYPIRVAAERVENGQSPPLHTVKS